MTEPTVPFMPSGMLFPDPEKPLEAEEIRPGLYVVRNAYAKDYGYFACPNFPPDKPDEPWPLARR